MGVEFSLFRSKVTRLCGGAPPGFLPLPPSVSRLHKIHVPGVLSNMVLCCG